MKSKNVYVQTMNYKVQHTARFWLETQVGMAGFLSVWLPQPKLASPWWYLAPLDIFCLPGPRDTTQASRVPVWIPWPLRKRTYRVIIWTRLRLLPDLTLCLSPHVIALAALRSCFPVHHTYPGMQLGMHSKPPLCCKLSQRDKLTTDKNECMTFPFKPLFGTGCLDWLREDPTEQYSSVARFFMIWKAFNILHRKLGNWTYYPKAEFTRHQRRYYQKTNNRTRHNGRLRRPLLSNCSKAWQTWPNTKFYQI